MLTFCRVAVRLILVSLFSSNTAILFAQDVLPTPKPGDFANSPSQARMALLTRPWKELIRELWRQPRVPTTT